MVNRQPAVIVFVKRVASYFVAFTLTGTAALAQSSTAPDQANAAPALEEVVVTAQRRSENLQSVPIAVTAITADRLKNAVIENTQDLAAVTPGLTFPSDFQYALPHIRGVGSTAVAPGAENSVALYVDGVYYASAAGSILDLNNVSQIEVLKGPQGTLFGRNATGGLIQVITKDPTQESHYEANLSYGNYNTSKLDAYVSGGITGNLAADLALEVSHQGTGWGKNYFNGADDYKLDRDIAARSKLLWTPGETTRVTLAIDFEDSLNSLALGTAPGTAAYNPFYPPAVVNAPAFSVDENVLPIESHKGGGASLRLEQDVGFADLVNIAAYRESNDYYAVDFDLGPDQVISDLTTQFDSQISEELQLRSHSSETLTWAAGLYYFHATDGYDPLHVGFGSYAETPIAPGLNLTDVITSATQHTQSVAGYLQGTYTIAPGYHLTAGIRYTHEKRSFDADETGLLNGTIPAPLLTDYSPSFSVNKPTWRLALDHNFSDDIMGYVSYNRGFKSGGYNPGSPTSPAYQTEQLDAYEAGMKNQFLDRRLRVNAAAFYYKYSNIQVSRFVDGTPAIYNGASARLYGLDLDADAAVTDSFTVSAGVEALHDYFNSFPCADFFVGGPQASSPACSASAAPVLPYSASAEGNKLPDAADFTSSVTFDYHQPVFTGVGHLSITDAYNSGFFYEPNNSPMVHQHAYNLVNASTTWTTSDEHYLIRLWGRNLADKIYSSELASSSTGFAGAYAPPRTYGITVGVKF